MLSPKENEILTRVGPGTKMGALLRRFWMPALLEEEISTPDGPPVRLRLLGEDLVAFRDTSGRVGIIAAHCAHRRAGLFFARNEECGLRCIYHGWKYDVDGNCVDIPSEPDGGAALKPMAKLASYPTAIRGGVVWIYMGPADAVAAPPDFEWSLLPERQRTATKRLQRCNWAQAVDGGIDSSHISFLHSRTETQKRPQGDPRDIALKYWQIDRHPVFELKDTPYGFMIGARRNLDDERCYWRITQFLLPFYTMVPPRNETADSRDAFFFGHAWVPIDDENTWTWSFSVHPTRPFTAEEHDWHGGRGGFWGPTDERFLPLHSMENDYHIDRGKQRTQSFSGIDGIPNQDSAVQESMGPIVDRSRELLGNSDRAVVRFRRLLLALAEECAAGKPIAAAAHAEWYKIRSASVILKSGRAFDEGSAWLVSGAARDAAE